MVVMGSTEQHAYYMYFSPFSHALRDPVDFGTAHALLSLGISYRHSQQLGTQQRKV